MIQDFMDAVERVFIWTGIIFGAVFLILFALCLTAILGWIKCDEND
jgi:hypothetical protein